MRRLLPLLLAVPIASCGAPEPAPAPEASETAVVQSDSSACEPVVYEESRFTHCLADPEKHRIATALAGRDGKPYRSLATFAANRAVDAPLVQFAMNAGMFDDDGQPIGYFVEDGDRLHRLNRNDGPGNFHLKPNGVFFGSDGDWEIRTSEDFYANVTQRPDFGTQSGPMLVINGELHEDIADDGESRLRRNAVGVDQQGRAHFVISDDPVSFGRLARYFRDILHTPNALFLDGSVSQLWDPENGRLDHGAPLGPLIVVEERAKAAP